MRKGILLCYHGTRSNEGIKDTIKLLKVFKKEIKIVQLKLDI